MDNVTREILEKYKNKLKSELGVETGEQEEGEIENTSTKEYKDFKNEMIPVHFSIYEKACNMSEKIFRIAPDEKKATEIQNAINTAHLNITPAGVASFAILGPLIIIMTGLFVSSGIPLAFKQDPNMFFMVFSLLVGVCIMFPLQRIPLFMADSWRLKASSQMVICIFYIVTYMRHTSNLELAIEFASSHLSGPLALDMKKVLWDIETQRFSTLKDSLDTYLETWRKYNLEFIESMHLIESSLYESSEERRLGLLEKSLDVMLEETFEKMLHYAHGLKSPITSLHMLGIILPVLGLVILPLVVNFMGNIKWYYLATVYNIAIPGAVFYLGKRILASRPTGYGDTDISEMNPELKKFKKINMKILGMEFGISPLFLAITVFAVCFLIGLSPLLAHVFAGTENIPIGEDDDFTTCKHSYCLNEYRTDETTGSKDGPYDLIPSVLSVFVPLSLGISVGLYYSIKSKRLIKLRQDAKVLEREFSSALFQLGNRLSDGLPAEVTFGKVAEVMQDTESGRFFDKVSNNIRKLGFSVNEAIFNQKVGAIKSYPSSTIQSSMKVLTQAIKKSPIIAAQAVLTISRYMKEMHRVDERLKDLLADIIASMKSQVSYLAPVISGIVIGITSMMTNILGKLGPALLARSNEGDMSVPMDFFGIGIPSYYFQIFVGIYVIEIIYILSILVNGIENGYDKLNEEYTIGSNLMRGTILYTTLALIVMVVFNTIADVVISSTLATT
ncbi:hypothetical protein JXB31_00815 [Candidatus Woesearchaeota archaeon]|nr:hypothetical protein [Candidatus Woesearchaeota archaeon]